MSKIAYLKDFRRKATYAELQEEIASLRAELLTEDLKARTEWVPVTLASDLRLIQILEPTTAHIGGLIDDDGEYAAMEMRIPSGFTELTRATVVTIGGAPLVSMALGINWQYATDLQAYNTHAGGAVYYLSTVAGDFRFFNILPDLWTNVPAFNRLASNDILGVKCYWVSGAPEHFDTDCYIIGLLLEWT